MDTEYTQNFNSVISHNNFKATINNLDFNENCAFNPKSVHLNLVLAKSYFLFKDAETRYSAFFIGVKFQNMIHIHK